MNEMRDITKGPGWYPPMVLGNSLMYMISTNYLIAMYFLLLYFSMYASVKHILVRAKVIISWTLLVILPACYCELLSSLCMIVSDYDHN